jgi:hypothetical protein
MKHDERVAVEEQLREPSASDKEIRQATILN